MLLRFASPADAMMPFKWRNDRATLVASINTSAIEYASHVEWLESSLRNPDRILMVGLKGEVAVETVRYDRHPPGWELSWTVAPEARGVGVGTDLVSLGARMMPEPLIAKIRPQLCFVQDRRACRLREGRRGVGADDLEPRPSGLNGQGH